jgi:hypothetical protein
MLGRASRCNLGAEYTTVMVGCREERDHVMEKAGLQYEGTLREELLHWGAFEDIDYYGLLRRDFLAKHIIKRKTYIVRRRADA